MKFKHAEAPGHYYKIDDSGKQSFNERTKPGWFQEMQDWVKAGNKIEPFETAEEQAAREAAEAEEALETQNQTIINLVKAAEYHFIPNSRHPDKDGKWAEWVGKLWIIYDSGIVQPIPDKPF